MRRAPLPDIMTRESPLRLLFSPSQKRQDTLSQLADENADNRTQNKKPDQR